MSNEKTKIVFKEPIKPSTNGTSKVFTIPAYFIRAGTIDTKKKYWLTIIEE